MSIFKTFHSWRLIGFYSLVGALFFLKAPSLAQKTVTQTLRGSVRDAANSQNLAGATIELLGQNQTTSADANGEFRLINVPIGRYSVQIKHIGYETVIIPEVLVEASKEKVLQVELGESSQKLNEVVVQTARPTAVNSVQTITLEQTLRHAATFFDPARLATSFAGVISSNDQANGLVIRGNSPMGTQWRLEGVEIVNPNHLSNAGTFSDRPSQTGGGVNILSAQLMERADFLTGAFPAQYGNALAGVMDIHLRKGNNQRHEFTGQAGLIGVDLSAEGPLSKKSKASYLVNYRYSFTGLLASMGVTFGGEDIRFQDFSFNLSFPTRRAGDFTVFGMGGISSNIFKAQRDTLQWKFQKDGFDIEFRNRMGAAGITHHLKLSRKTTWHTVVAMSGLEAERRGIRLRKTDFAPLLSQTDDTRKTRYTLSSSLAHKFNADWQLKTGFYATSQLDSAEIFDQGFFVNGGISGWILQPYATVSGRLSPRLNVQAGVHYLRYTFNKSQSVEPRVALRYVLNTQNALNVSYGLHSQLQMPQTYLSLFNASLGGIQNLNLGLTRAHHWVIGYEHFWKKQHSLKIEAYYQSLFNVPIADNRSISFRYAPAFSALNLIEGVTEFGLMNGGTGRNYGLEMTYQRFLQNDFYTLLTASIYNSLYKGYDGIERSTRFNGGHTFSLTGGKEFRRRPNRVFGVNTRILWLGGFRDSPIDTEASRLAGRTVYKNAELYSIKLKDYFRPDVRIYWKKNKSNYTRTWSIDIQNLTSTQNEAYSYYDILQRQVVQQYQLGIVPVINYRVEF